MGKCGGRLILRLGLARRTPAKLMETGPGRKAGAGKFRAQWEPGKQADSCVREW